MPALPVPCAATHTGFQLQLVEGTLVVVAEAAIENDGAVGQDPEEVLAVPGVRDDLRQSSQARLLTALPPTPALRDLGSNPGPAMDRPCDPREVT